MAAWTSPSTGNRLQEINSHRPVPGLSLPPSTRSQEGTGQVLVRQSQNHRHGAEQTAEGRASPHQSPEAERVPQCLHSLTKVKDPLTMEKQTKVVYCIPYSCGEAYIGETVRRLETKVKEHRDACQKGALEKSALAEHAWMNHHPIKWEEVSMIVWARTAKELLVKEAIYILLNHPSLNWEGGLELPRYWMAALRNIGSVSNQKTCGAN